MYDFTSWRLEETGMVSQGWVGPGGELAGNGLGLRVRFSVNF